MTTIAHGSAVPVSGPPLDNRRVLAALIDLAVVGAGAAVIFAAAGGAVRASLVAVVLAWALYYYFACESGAGQTLGKKVMRLRVVRTDGAPAGMREIAIRTVVRLIDMQFVYLVGLIAMLATGERRGRLGDLAAGTMVAAADGEATAAPAPATVASSAAEPETVTLPRREPVEAEPELEPVVEPEPEPVVESALEPVAQPEPEPDHPGLRPLRPLEPLEEDAPDDEPRPEDLPPAADALPDVMSPSLQELAEDVAAAMESTLAEDSTVDAGRR